MLVSFGGISDGSVGGLTWGGYLEEPEVVE